MPPQNVVSRRITSTLPALARIPWWHWTGGLLGALYVVTAVVVAPRLGATALIALVTFAVLWRFKVPEPIVVLAAAAVGLGAWLLVRV